MCMGVNDNMGFFDKVITEISNVGETSKGVVEKAKLNVQIQNYDKKKILLAQNMGLLVYNLIKNNKIAIPQCEDIFSEMESCDMAVMQLQNEINSFDNRNFNDMNYEQDFSDGILCECGCMNHNQAGFCRNCGARLGNEGNDYFINKEQGEQV